MGEVAQAAAEGESLPSRDTEGAPPVADGGAEALAAPLPLRAAVGVGEGGALPEGLREGVADADAQREGDAQEEGVGEGRGDLDAVAEALPPAPPREEGLLSADALPVAPRRGEAEPEGVPLP